MATPRVLGRDLLLASAAKRRVWERVAFGTISSVALFAFVPALLVFGYIAVNGAKRLDWEFLSQAPNAVDASGGVFPAIVGTVIVMLGTIVLALPLGIAGAIYLSEYARSGKVSRLIRMAIVNLAGVPSIVHGLFGLGFFVIFVGGAIDRLVLQSPTPVWGKPCILWGCCTLAIVVLPVIITATEEAILSVPASFREASMGVGATKWQTIRRVVLPSALPGILTGAILSIGRVAGETAPIMVTCAASFMPYLPQKLNDQAMLLPYHLYFVVTQVPNPKVELQAGTALLLMLIVFSFAISAIALRTRMRKLRKW